MTGVIDVVQATADGIRWHGKLRYRELPQRPQPVGTASTTFLLVHGLGGSLEQWNAIATPLRSAGRVLAVDIPGFGRSREANEPFDIDKAVEVLLDFVRARQLENCVLVSHSIGCLVVARLATTAPGTFRRVVLVSGALSRACRLARQPLHSGRSPRLALYVAMQFIAGSLPIPAWGLKALGQSPILRRATLWPFVADPGSLPGDELVAALCNSGSPAVLEALSSATRVPYETIVGRIPQEVDLIYGARDHLINTEDVAVLGGLVRLTEPVAVPGCAHWVWIECPDEIAQFILRAAWPYQPGNHEPFAESI